MVEGLLRPETTDKLPPINDGGGGNSRIDARCFANWSCFCKKTLREDGLGIWAGVMGVVGVMKLTVLDRMGD